MPLTIAAVASTLQTVLTAEADAAARATGFIRRQRQLTGASFVQSLVFGWLANPRATLEGLAAATATVGTPVSPQALDQRFTAPAAECLRVVLQKATAQTLAAEPQAVALLRRFAGVYLLDSTTVSLPAALAELWPGCGGRTAASGRAALKVQLLWDILHGRLHGLDLHAGRAVDVEAPLNAAALPAGALRLADLGYFNLDVLRAYQRRGVYWLTRLKWGTALYVGGRRLRHRVGWLKRQAQAPCDVDVEVGGRHRLPCRLVAVRVPQAVARVRRQRLRQKARDHGERVRPERLAACAWDLWLTNVPRSLLRGHEVRVLARLRWQVELLFKRWKSQGKLAEWRSAKPYRVLCEVYAKLLGQLVQQWVLLLHWRRQAGRSLWQAARLVQDYAVALAVVLAQRPLLIWLLGRLHECLGHAGRLQKRKKKPATFQLLQAATGPGDEPPQAQCQPAP